MSQFPQKNVYKRQHHVPCSYLWFFSSNSDWSLKRKTRVWFTDGKQSENVIVEDLARDDYTYSRATPEFDKIFNRREVAYPVVVNKLLQGEELGETDFYHMVSAMLELHARNLLYVNGTDQERKHVFMTVYTMLLKELFGVRGNARNWKPMYILPALKDHWHLHLLWSHEQDLITSDNPVRLFVDETNGAPVVIILPVHPRLAVIAKDRRCGWKITTGMAGKRSVDYLNYLQVDGCNKQIYSSFDIQEHANIAEGSPLSDRLKISQGTTKGEVTSDTIKPGYLTMWNQLGNGMPFMTHLGHGPIDSLSGTIHRMCEANRDLPTW